MSGNITKLNKCLSWVFLVLGVVVLILGIYILWNAYSYADIDIFITACIVFIAPALTSFGMYFLFKEKGD